MPRTKLRVAVVLNRHNGNRHAAGAALATLISVALTARQQKSRHAAVQKCFSMSVRNKKVEEAASKEMIIDNSDYRLDSAVTARHFSARR